MSHELADDWWTEVDVPSAALTLSPELRPVVPEVANDSVAAEVATLFTELLTELVTLLPCVADGGTVDTFDDVLVP